MAQPLLPAPKQLISSSVEPSQLAPSPQQFASRGAAVETLDSFLAGRGFRYTREMSSPVTAETACSRLSEFLAWGQLSLREVVHETRSHSARLAGATDPESKIWRQSLRSFDARLHWHCHFI